MNTNQKNVEKKESEVVKEREFVKLTDEALDQVSGGGSGKDCSAKQARRNK